MGNLGAAIDLMFSKTEKDTLDPGELLVLFKAIEGGEIQGDKFHKCLKNTIDAQGKRIEELEKVNAEWAEVSTEALTDFVELMSVGTDAEIENARLREYAIVLERIVEKETGRKCSRTLREEEAGGTDDKSQE